MHRQYGFHFIVEQPINFLRIEIHCEFRRLAKHRLKTVVAHGQYARNEGVGWDYHLVALVEQSHFFIGTKYKFQSIKSIAYSHTIFRFAFRRYFLLKQVCFFAMQVSA